MANTTSLLERMRDMAVSVGLDPDDALNMSITDFARTVATRRALRAARRDSQTALKLSLSLIPVRSDRRLP